MDPVGTAKHKLYRLYQANKDLEGFLNTFLVLAKKAKLDDSHTLDLLYEKLSDEFINFFITKKKQTNFDNLIKKLCNIDASMKIINQQKRTALAVNTPKLIYQQATIFVLQTTRFASVTLTTTTITTSSTLLFTATGTYARPMDVSSLRQGSLTAEEKEHQSKLSLCRYCGQLGHIAIEHKDLNTLLARRRTAEIHKMTITPLSTMALLSNNILENTPFPSTVALEDLLD